MNRYKGMFDYKTAIEEYGNIVANIMLEEEYNQFIRGRGYLQKKTRATDENVDVIFEDD